MKCLLTAVNAKYIHSNPAVYTLKACAAEIPGVQVEIGEYTINHRVDEILDSIYMKKADMVCFSCYIWNIEYVKTLVRDLRLLCPGLLIWLGGPEVSFHCEELLEELPEADGILYGEGEESFPALLRHYIRKEPWPEGCVYREGGRIRRTPPAALTDLARLPFPYADLKGFENRILYDETSRGCPFSCSYCLSSIDKRLRFRPVELVKRELSFFLERKVPQVKFVDRTFNSREERALEIWSYIRDHDNGVTNFHFEITAEILTEKELELLGTMRPGLIQLEIGVQSTNPRTAKAVGRRVEPARLRAVTETIGRRRNVHQHLDLIAGLPLEDYESFGRSFDDVWAMGPDQLQLGFLKVLKGSPMETDAPRYGILARREPPYEVLLTGSLSHEELIRLKQIEEMVEIYYNSRQFTHTLKELEARYKRPFVMLEQLSAAWEAAGMGGKRHRREAVYCFLYQFAGEWFPEEEKRFARLLTLDYYLRENAKKRPAFAPPERREKVREWVKRLFPERKPGEILREGHGELFGPPLTEKTELWLFDYSRRDPLTGNADVKQYQIEEDAE